MSVMRSASQRVLGGAPRNAPSHLMLKDGGGSRAILYKDRKPTKEQQAKLDKIMKRQEKKSALEQKYYEQTGKYFPAEYHKVGGRWTKDGAMRRSSSTSQIPSKIEVATEPVKVVETPVVATRRGDEHEYGSDGEEKPKKRTQLVEAYKRKGNQLDWVSLMEYNKAVVALDTSIETAEMKQIKKMFRDGLERQLQEREDIHAQEAAQKQREREVELQRYKKACEDADRDAARRKQLVEVEKKIRLQQIQDNIDRKQRGLEAKKRHNEEMLVRMQADALQLKKEAVDRKMREKLKLERVKKENEVIEAQKEREHKQAEEEEHARQKAYSAQVMAQEAAREGFFESKAKQQEANGKQLIASTEAINRAIALTDQRIIEAREAYDREQLRLQREKDEKRKRTNEEIKQELHRQVEARKEAKRSENLAKIDAREAAEKASRKNNLAEQAAFLEKQMIELEIRKVKERAAMSDVEVQFNAKQIEKIKKKEILPSTSSGIRPRPY